ncbi:MAG: hypothetical protein AAB770_01595 [Patescibacteria group bacterium]
MEQEILERIKAQEELLQKIYVSTEKTRKYFMWTLIISVAVVILPLIGLMAIIPSFLSTAGSAYGI